MARPLPMSFPSCGRRRVASTAASLPRAALCAVLLVLALDHVARPDRVLATPVSARVPELAAVGKADAEANVAFFIQIANNTVDHLPRLLRTLYHPQNAYAVHFDLKIPKQRVDAVMAGIMRENVLYGENVFVMDSELITYRGVSMLLNTINAISLLLRRHKTWHYFVNISGADYPLISPKTMRVLLGKQLGMNFFTFAPTRTWDDMAENRLSEVWYDEALTFRAHAEKGSLKKLVVRNPLVDDREFVVAHAEAWLIGSREFCEYVVRDDDPRKMLVAFAYAVDSSEHYFASLAWNSERFKDTIVPHSLREIVWLHDGVYSGQHPYNIDEKDEKGEWKFMSYLDVSVLFFARKFQKPDSQLMDIVDKRAKQDDVIAKVGTHIENKVRSRQLRVSEL